MERRKDHCRFSFVSLLGVSGEGLWHRVDRFRHTCVLMPVDTVSKSLLSELNETNNEAADSPAGQVFSLVVISVGRDETTKFRWEVTLKCTPPISLKKINETTPSDDPRPMTMTPANDQPLFSPEALLMI